MFDAPRHLDSVPGLFTPDVRDFRVRFLGITGITITSFSIHRRRDRQADLPSLILIRTGSTAGGYFFFIVRNNITTLE